ncbi:hypothetical protein BJ508DRAFT_333064 [Ascobolus immersus RN42]|uniref:Uncharacterized protein n=1 Tax=Ascobolus immersus RN42 TaxID=1160509 RepID=A0A3N4HPJ8_ASCIM|nr:hypothetical protein BJ508DRAFT_333064 [Ascobolus immersus RN42]
MTTKYTGQVHAHPHRPAPLGPPKAPHTYCGGANHLPEISTRTNIRDRDPLIYQLANVLYELFHSPIGCDTAAEKVLKHFVHQYNAVWESQSTLDKLTVFGFVLNLQIEDLECIPYYGDAFDIEPSMGIHGAGFFRSITDTPRLFLQAVEEVVAPADKEIHAWSSSKTSMLEQVEKAAKKRAAKEGHVRSIERLISSAQRLPSLLRRMTLWHFGCNKSLLGSANSNPAPVDTDVLHQTIEILSFVWQREWEHLQRQPVEIDPKLKESWLAEIFAVYNGFHLHIPRIVGCPGPGNDPQSKVNLLILGRDSQAQHFKTAYENMKSFLKRIGLTPERLEEEPRSRRRSEFGKSDHYTPHLSPSSFQQPIYASGHPSQTQRRYREVNQTHHTTPLDKRPTRGRHRTSTDVEATHVHQTRKPEQDRPEYSTPAPTRASIPAGFTQAQGDSFRPSASSDTYRFRPSPPPTISSPPTTSAPSETLSTPYYSTRTDYFASQSNSSGTFSMTSLQESLSTPDDGATGWNEQTYGESSPLQTPTYGAGSRGPFPSTDGAYDAATGYASGEPDSLGLYSADVVDGEAVYAPPLVYNSTGGHEYPTSEWFGDELDALQYFRRNLYGDKPQATERG